MPYMHQNRGGFDLIKLGSDIAIAAVSTFTDGRLKYRPMPLVALVFLLFYTNTAYALTQTRLPTAAADCTNVAGIGTRTWGNPGRAISSNNSYATASVDGTTTNYLRCLNYGFTIPLTATIDGITVDVERRSSRITDGGSRDAAMRIVQGGTIGSTDRSTATTYTLSDLIEAHGGAADIWGLIWTPADINAANFGTAFAATKPSSAGNSHTISVDMLRITVTYTPDTTPPTVSSLTRADPNPSAATTVSWNVVFSEAVTGVDAGDFALVPVGVSGASITSVTGSGTSWTVTANTGSNSGTLGLNLVDNDTVIDSAGNSLGGTGVGNGNYTGEVYTIDKSNPQVGSINRADPDPTSASSVSWTVLFSESVTGVGISDFALAVSGLSGTSITSVTGSGDTWTVTASTGTGSGTLGLNLVDDDTIIDSAANPLGGTGANNGNFTGQVYTITLPVLAAYSMDEIIWNGTAAEVSDSMGSYPGTARNSATTAGVSPAIPGSNGTCRYGVFDNGTTITNGYVELPGFPNLATDFTITAWIRTTDNTVGAQRIFIDDESNSGGYGLSLGEGGTGVLRFYSRGSSVIILDTPNVIANNTWYFVAGVADITNGVRRIYIFDATGTILPGLPVSVASTGWGTDAGMASIGGETNSSGEPPLTNHFRGNIDEVAVYNTPLDQATLTTLAQQTHACAAAAVDHYELSLPTASVTCLPTTVTVTACADATSPCTNNSTSVSGQTATLAGSGGTLGSTTATFDATGVAATTLSYAAAANGTTVTVTLSGESTPAAASRQCCPDGTGCVVANSCSTLFNTAGFIFANSAGGAGATIPTQVAGTSSGTYYLRAVKTSTTTKACEAALVGTTAVDYAYECNNPTTCSASNLMSVNGGTGTTIARNNNGSVSSYLPVNMVFDANGNAPFSFTYDDVGQVTLHTRKIAGGTLLSDLTGSSNAFVVKPGGFVLSGIQQTAAPQLANPAAANAAGAKFVRAGEQFTVSVRATTSGGTTTPNFGKETTPEGVKLTAALVGGLGLSNNPPLGFTTGFGAFNNGSATGTDFSWGEVGIITLTPSISDGDYLGVGEVTGAASTNVGRFFPHHFRVTPVPEPTLVDACLSGSFTYLGQPFTYTAAPVLTITAENQANTTTSNYDCGGFWKLSEPYALDYTYTDGAGAGPTLTPNSGSASPPVTVPTATSDCNGSISLTISDDFTYSRPALTSPVSPFSAKINLAATAAQFTDSDGACFDTGSGCQGFSRTNISGATLRLGQTITSNAYGPETATITEPLILPVTIQYYNNTAQWVTNADDNCSQFTYLITPDGSITVNSSPVSPVTTTSGRGNLQLWPTADPGAAGGQVLIDYTLPAWLGPNAQAEAFFGIYRGNDRIINWRELVR